MPMTIDPTVYRAAVAALPGLADYVAALLYLSPNYGRYTHRLTASAYRKGLIAGLSPEPQVMPYKPRHSYPNFMSGANYPGDAWVAGRHDGIRVRTILTEPEKAAKIYPSLLQSEYKALPAKVRAVIDASDARRRHLSHRKWANHMNTLTDRNVEAAARAHADAKEAHAQRKGEVIAAVKKLGHLDLPKPVSAALTRLELAEGALEAARDRASEARRAALSDDDKAASLHFGRISALIAAHVVGLKLIKDPAEVHPWRVVERDGRRRAVPQYANEFASIASAERLLDGPQQERYGKYLAELFACDFHRIATANPYARASAILHAIGIDPDSEPPALAQ